MAEPGNPHSPGLDTEGHVRGLVQAGLRYVEIRGQLFQIETQEAGSHISKVASRGVIALGCLMVAWLLAMPAAVVLAAEYLKPRWPWVRWEYVALGLALIHLLLGFLFLLAAKKRWMRVRLYEESLNQFQKDREWVARSQQPLN